MNKHLTRQIFELRFFPTHAFFDHRSQLLEVLYRDRKTKKKNFEHWQLENNRVDLFDADRKRLFFFSFRNCGLTCENPPTAHYFNDQLQKYLGLSMEILGDYIEEVQRVGFRTTTVIAVDDFDKLKDSLVKNFLKTENPFFKALGASITDLQLFPIIFRQGNNDFQVTLGPAKAQQLGQLWGSKTDIPEQGLILDVDYYTTHPKVEMELTAYSGNFVTKAMAVEDTVLEELTTRVLNR